VNIGPRKKPRFVKAGSSNVQISANKCAIAAQLVTQGAAASAAFYNAPTITGGNATIQKVMVLAVGPQTGSVGDLSANLVFETGCTVSVAGDSVNTWLNIAFVDLAAEDGL